MGFLRGKLLGFLLFACCWMGSVWGAGKEVTPAQLAAVHQAYVEAKKGGFDVKSLVALYDLPNAASAVKKLVDAHQSNPSQAISPDDSASMEATRETMNIRILERLAKATGGSVEVINFGKQNGIRSDKDQTIFSVDGKRFYSANELMQEYGKLFREEYGIDMELMDMTLFDGDASVPDWRRTDTSFEEHVAQFEKGQAKREQNPEAVQEAGAYRAGVDRRTATQGRVTLVRTDRETGEVLPPVYGTAQEISSAYKGWTADVPYRNAMDSVVENRRRFKNSADFIDRMKYFNRTVGTGINALALENWSVDYIFHLRDLSSDERQAFIRQMVDDVFVVDASEDDRQLFARVAQMAAEIEIDKMKGQTRAESEYLEPFLEGVSKDAKSQGEEIDEAETLRRAREKFYGYLSRAMDYNLIATTRQKILRDFNPDHLKRIAAKYGKEQAKKLRWETARQIQRAFDKIEDDRLAKRLVSEAPEHLKAEVEAMYELSKAKRTQREPGHRQMRLEPSDPMEAKVTGPQEKVLSEKKESFISRRKQEIQQLIERIQTGYKDFSAEVEAGKYSDEQISNRLRERVMDSLGFEDRAVMKNLEVEYEQKFSGSKLLGNVVNLGNADAVLNIIQVYQQTGNMVDVSKAAIWELLSTVPGVSQVATLKQSFNDGNAEGLYWLFIAWQIPAAGQAKFVFDVAKNAMTVVYTHAMQPLKDDRFSQIYRGYVDKQPAGWSPFRPGFKERREAVSHSILYFVPGDSFEEKRAHLYSYFQDKLDKKLTANGYDPTTDAYWEARDRALPAFFRKYVHDYMAAEGEWSENVTQGLYWMGEQTALQDRLAQQLLSDFQQGETDYRLAEVAEEEMQKAMAQMEEMVAESLRLEKQLAAAEDRVVEAAQKIQGEQLDKADTLAGKNATRVEVQVYPPVVVEGQEAFIAVKAFSEHQEGKPSRPHQIEIKRAAGEALVSGEPVSELADVVEKENLDLVKPLADKEPDGTKVYVSRISYDVTVKDADGKVLETKKVHVDLAGAEEQPDQEIGDGPTIMIQALVGEETGSGGFGTKKVYEWQHPSKENAHAGVIGARYSDKNMAYLFIRWPDMPEGMTVGALVQAQGGIPPMEEKWVTRQRPDPGFPQGREIKAEDGPGNAFIIPIPLNINEIHAGDVKISGRLMAFERGVSSSDYETTTPEAELPFEASLHIYDPVRKASGQVTVDAKGSLSGSVTIIPCQKGRRVAKVEVAGSTYYNIFSCGTRFEVFRTRAEPDTAVVTYEDFGKMVSVTVPLEVKKLNPSSYQFSQEEVDRQRERIKEDLDQFQKNRKHSGEIAYLYLNATRIFSIASYYGQFLNTQYDNWKKTVQEYVQTMERALGLVGNPDWEGYKFGISNPDLEYVGSTAQDRAERAKGNHLQAVVRYFYDLVRFFEDANRIRSTEDMRWLLAKMEQVGPPLFATERWGNATLSIMANRYSDLAAATLFSTGDMATSLSLYDKYNDYMKKAEALKGREHTPREFYYRADPQFSK